MISSLRRVLSRSRFSPSSITRNSADVVVTMASRGSMIVHSASGRPCARQLHHDRPHAGRSPASPIAISQPSWLRTATTPLGTSSSINVGMANVERSLASLGLKNTHLQRKLMDIEAARQGREKISTPREMMTLRDAIYRDKLLHRNSLRISSRYFPRQKTAASPSFFRPI
jgi:hypothetical protein